MKRNVISAVVILFSVLATHGQEIKTTKCEFIDVRKIGGAPSTDHAFFVYKATDMESIKCKCEGFSEGYI